MTHRNHKPRIDRLSFFLPLVLLAACAGISARGVEVGRVSAPPADLNLQLEPEPALPAAAKTAPNGPVSTLRSQFVCRIIDRRAMELGIHGTDIGLGALRSNDITWLLFGDVIESNSRQHGSSAAALFRGSFNACSQLEWITSRDNSYPRFWMPLHSRKLEGVDASTLPSGAIEIDRHLYIFGKRILHWHFRGGGATTGYGLLFREVNGEFRETGTTWQQDGLHLNNAPLLVQEPDGREMIYIMTTGKFRSTPVYLARVAPERIEEKNAYTYFRGRDTDGRPLWTPEVASAVPLEGMADLKAGELSFVYDEPLGTYLVMLKDHASEVGPGGWFYLYLASNPAGPYRRYRVEVCEHEGGQADWMEADWSGCYGGYIIPRSFGSDGRDLYFTVSIWRPYTDVVMRLRLPEEP